MGFAWFVVLGLLGFAWEGFWWLLGVGVVLHILLLCMEIGIAYKERKEQEVFQNDVQQIQQIGRNMIRELSYNLEEALEDKRVVKFFQVLNAYKTHFKNPDVVEVFKEDMFPVFMLGHMTLVLAMDIMGEIAAKGYKLMVSDLDTGNLWLCVSCMATEHKSGNNILDNFDEYVHLVYVTDVENSIVEYKLVHLEDLELYINVNDALPFKTIQAMANSLRKEGL